MSHRTPCWLLRLADTPKRQDVWEKVPTLEVEGANLRLGLRRLLDLQSARG